MKLRNYQGIRKIYESPVETKNPLLAPIIKLIASYTHILRCSCRNDGNLDPTAKTLAGGIIARNEVMRMINASPFNWYYLDTNQKSKTYTLDLEFLIPDGQKLSYCVLYLDFRDDRDLEWRAVFGGNIKGKEEKGYTEITS